MIRVYSTTCLYSFSYGIIFSTSKFKWWRRYYKFRLCGLFQTIRCWTVQSIFVSHFLSTVFFLFAFYLHLHTFIVKCELKTIAPATFVTPFFSISNFLFSNLTVFLLWSIFFVHIVPKCVMCCISVKPVFVVVYFALCYASDQGKFSSFIWFLVHLLSWTWFYFFRFVFFVFDFVRGQSSSRSSTRFAHNFLWKRVCFYAFRCLLEAWEFSCLLIIFSPKNKKKRTTATTTRDK